MKYFVISDVHGYYKELIDALIEKDFDINNPNHIIISCGDACDRGEQSKEVLTFLTNLYDENRAILIKGNHEDLMEDAMTRGYFMSHDIHNGTTKTVCQLTGIEDSDEALMNMRYCELWNKYICSCVDYYELQDYIFVHGWIPMDIEVDEDNPYKDLPKEYWQTKLVYNPNWRDTIWGDEWRDARWANGMKMWRDGIREPNKTIVCGHYHTSWGHSRLHGDGREWLEPIETYYIDPDTGKQEPHVNYEPFYDEGIIAIDACTAVSHKVNVLVIEC